MLAAAPLLLQVLEGGAGDKKWHRGEGGAPWDTPTTPPGPTLTSVRTSRTDLKSLDMEASLDWEGRKGEDHCVGLFFRGGGVAFFSGGGLFLGCPPPPPPYLQGHHDSVGVRLDVAPALAAPRPHQVLQLGDLLVQAADILHVGGSRGTVKNYPHPPKYHPPPPSPPRYLLDDVGELLDLHRLVVEEGFPLGHCQQGGGRHTQRGGAVLSILAPPQ